MSKQLDIPGTEQKPVIETNEMGEMQFSSLESQLALAQRLLQNRVISDTFKTPQQVVIAIQYCIALNIRPMVGLKMMYIVHGKPALFGDGPLSLIQSAGKLDWIEEFWVDDEGERICVKNKNLKAVPYAAVCRLKRVNDDQIQEDYFTVDDMKLAQMKSPTWNRYQRTMMRYRARTQALKSKFADVLNGIEIAEYSSNDLPQENVRIDSPYVGPVTEDQIIQMRDLMAKLNRNEPSIVKHLSVKFKREIAKLQDLNEDEARQAISEMSQFAEEK